MLGRQAVMSAFRGVFPPKLTMHCINDCILRREGPGPCPHVKAGYVWGPETRTWQHRKHRAREVSLSRRCCWRGPGDAPLPRGRKPCFAVSLHLGTSPSVSGYQDSSLPFSAGGMSTRILYVARPALRRQAQGKLTGSCCHKRAWHSMSSPGRGAVLGGEEEVFRQLCRAWGGMCAPAPSPPSSHVPMGTHSPQSAPRLVLDGFRWSRM